MRALLAAGPSGLAAEEIAARLAMPASALSFQLRTLGETGLVAATVHGRSLVHAARIARLRALVAFPVDACRGGEAARCGDLHRLFDTGPETVGMETSCCNVLFLRARNSARSIMAGGILADGTPLKVHARYDDGMGYACRKVDLAGHMPARPCKASLALRAAGEAGLPDGPPRPWRAG